MFLLKDINQCGFLSHLYTPGMTMRTGLFFIAHLWKRLLRAFGTHLAASFNPMAIDPENSCISFLLGLEHCSEKILLQRCVPLPSSILSLEPLAGSGIPLSFKSVPHKAIGIESLEHLGLLLQSILASPAGITPLIVNMSQIPCHRVHRQSLTANELASCHKKTVQKIIIELHTFSFKHKQYLIIIDNSELLGYKNSALLERLYSGK